MRKWFAFMLLLESRSELLLLKSKLEGDFLIASIRNLGLVSIELARVWVVTVL